MRAEDGFRKAEAVGDDSTFIRLDEYGTGPVFTGLDHGRRAILVVCPDPPPPPPVFQALPITVNLRRDGRWALVVGLTDPSLAPLFNRVAQDLAHALDAGGGDLGAVAVRRLTRWGRMFQRGSNGLLDEAGMLGLAAELVFLAKEAVPHVGPAAAVEAWVGPYDSPKDFVFADLEVEVKAVGDPPRHVRISSLDQLDHTGRPLYLWCMPTVLDLHGTGNGVPLAALVEQARSAVGDDENAARGLERALAAAGWENREEYSAVHVETGAPLCHAVGDGFPRLARTSLPAGILEGRYTLAMEAVGPFRAAIRWDVREESNGAT